MATTVKDANVEIFQNGSSKSNILNESQNLLHTIASQEGFTNYDINTSVRPSDGGNYMGIVSDVTIVGKKAGKGRKVKEEKLHLFLKTAASSEHLREICDIHTLYCKEIFVYKDISRLYTELQMGEAIQEEEMYRFTKFYGSIDSGSSETIVLQNLSYQNYAVQDRFQCVTLEYAQSAVAELAKFHALSYILERRDPDYFERELKTKTGNMYLHQTGPERLKQSGPMLTDIAVDNVRNPEYVDRVRQVSKDLFENITKYVKVNKHQAICHGDYRGNNILVKYVEGELKSIVPIDYQLLHYGSPINDLLYFVFLATDSRFRSQHLDSLTRHYRHTLRTFLRHFSLDVEDVYPEKHFEEDVKNHMMLGFVIAVHLLPLILASSDGSLDLDNWDISSIMEIYKKPNKLYQDRFNEIVEEFVLWGYI